MLPIDFKPSLPLSEDQATLLRGYTATSEMIYLLLLGDRLIEDGSPFYGEMLLRGVEKGVVGRYQKPGSQSREVEVYAAWQRVTTPLSPWAQVRCLRLHLSGGEDAVVAVDVPASGSEIADLIEATQTVKPRSVLAHEIAGLRSGEVKVWLDYLPADAVN